MRLKIEERERKRTEKEMRIKNEERVGQLRSAKSVRGTDTTHHPKDRQ